MIIINSRFICYNSNWLGWAFGLESFHHEEQEAPRLVPWDSLPHPGTRPAAVMDRIGRMNVCNKSFNVIRCITFNVFPSVVLIAGCICFATLMDHPRDWPLLCDHVTRRPGPLHLMMLSIRPETREQRDFSRDDTEAVTELREKLENVITNPQQSFIYC